MTVSRDSVLPLVHELAVKSTRLEHIVADGEHNSMEILAKLQDICKLADALRSIAAVCLED